MAHYAALWGDMMGLLFYGFLTWLLVRMGLGELLFLIAIIAVLAACYGKYWPL